MIAIVNISTRRDYFGENEYSPRINYKEICRFKHIRAEPLSVILARASEAAQLYEIDKEMRLIEAECDTPEYKYGLSKDG